ncbi:MAG TPA: hypothetical protein VFO21_21665 [Vicinamibacterales bacterium]|nr:hypothetical protein [Vicinamibacterales bacterium]
MTEGRRKRRFLFVMQYPGYLRYFDSTVRGLAARGHHVEVIFDKPNKQAEGAEALAGVPGVDILDGRPPSHGDEIWSTVARATRGTIDYVRYYHPKFVDAVYLRDRMRKVVPPVFRFLARRNSSTAGVTRALVWFFTVCEKAIPSSVRIERFIKSRHADAVLVTPLVTARCGQTDYVKSAQALGIPAAACIASWDHLTTKGLIRVRPDLVSVWNREQQSEAVEFHGIDPAHIVVTGAQPFDRWFERTPTDRGAFCRKIGLSADRPLVLFVGSTASISAPEAELLFVRRWIAALRDEPRLADVGILIRPHPYNSTHWLDADFSDLPNVAIYPRGANPVNESDRQDYFDSLFHSAAVVGVNTTAMIEAAIVGRTVHSVLAPEFQDTQGGTLHFRYLLAENGGFLRVAQSLPEHARQVAETVESPAIGRAACDQFVERFVRPHGRSVAATPLLVDALEKMASKRRTRATVPIVLYPLQALLKLAGSAAVRRARRRPRAAAPPQSSDAAQARGDQIADVPTTKAG